MGFEMIWLLGDVHGEFGHVIRMVKRHRPQAIIFLGDLECALPLDMVLQPILDLTQIWYIHGNHDSDQSAYWNNLHANSLSKRSLHGKVVEIAGQRVAGLGGTFEAIAWLPGAPDTSIQNYDDLLASLERRPQHEDILRSKKQRALSAIYPDDYFGLAMESADILVCHEAPSCHPYGYKEIDELAQAMSAKQVFHGHHHDCRDYQSDRDRLGFSAHGVGFRGIMTIDGQIIL
jgi:predicted phosphodiesterase